jgi:hypothetical protein
VFVSGSSVMVDKVISPGMAGRLGAGCGVFDSRFPRPLYARQNVCGNNGIFVGRKAFGNGTGRVLSTG